MFHKEIIESFNANKESPIAKILVKVLSIGKASTSLLSLITKISLSLSYTATKFLPNESLLI